MFIPSPLENTMHKICSYQLFPDATRLIFLPLVPTFEVITFFSLFFYRLYCPY